jgi:hypothetical protein
MNSGNTPLAQEIFLLLAPPKREIEKFFPMTNFSLVKPEGR